MSRAWWGVVCALAIWGCAESPSGDAEATDGPRGQTADVARPDPVQDAGAAVDDPDDGVPPTMDAGSPDPDPDPDAGPPMACAVTPAAATARLLTRLEYDHILRDVLGDDTAPARALPPENEVLGFDNNAEFHRATPALVAGYLELAEDVARRGIAERRARVMTCGPNATAACARSLLETTGRRLFRRALRPAEVDAFTALFEATAAEAGTNAGARLTLTALLQSPQFLYRLEEIAPGEIEGAVTPISSIGLAGRLAAFLWASAPDDALIAVAEAGDLNQPEVLRREVERMIADPRAREAVAHFHRQWLGLKALDTLVKDHIGDFPGGQDGLRAAYAQSIQAFLEEAFWTEGDGMAQMLSSPTVYLSPPLAALFGVEIEGGMAAVSFPEQRAGLITQPALLARLAHPEQTSPIHRGIFVRERILCEFLPPPPPDVVLEPPDPDPNATTRERFAEHTENERCQGCHVLIDPIGFGFEGYDELGRYRETENGIPVDVSGALVAPGNEELDGPFEGAVELALRLARSSDARRCVATHWYRYALARGEQRFDRCALEQVQAAFVDSGSFADLLVSLALNDAFRTRPGVVIGEVPPLELPDPPDDEPPPPAPDQGRRPQGVLDGVTAAGEAHGWTFDPDTPEAPTLVELYLDGGPGAGLYLGGFRANVPRPDVNRVHPDFPGDHGFRVLLPDVARDGLDHRLHAVARNSGEGDDFTLAGSPMAFRAGLNADPPPEANPPPNRNMPQGFVDVVRADGIVGGWALDQDVVGRPIEVHLYLDGPAFAGGTALGSVNTGIARPDVEAAIGHPGDHGWQFQLPPEVFDGREHQLYVYAFNAGHPGNVNLSRSPFTFTLGGGQ